MTIPQSAQAYTLGTGTRTINAIVFSTRDPSSSDTHYPLGQRWLNYVGQSEWALVGVTSSTGILTAVWAGLGGGAAGVDTINTLPPTAGNITIAGTANQIGIANAGSTVTLSLIGPYTPATYTAHGVLLGEGTGSIVATAAGATNSVLQGSTGADPAFTTTPTVATLTTTGAITAGTGVTATTGNIAASAGNLSASGTVTGGTGVIATTGNVSAIAGAVNAGTSMTATLGNITATNGNLVLGTGGNKLVIHATTAATDSVGTSSVMAGTPGTVTVTTSACTTISTILYSRNVTGGTPGEVSITSQLNGSFVLTSTANETSTFNYMIIN